MTDKRKVRLLVGIRWQDHEGENWAVDAGAEVTVLRRIPQPGSAVVMLELVAANGLVFSAFESEVEETE